VKREQALSVECVIEGEGAWLDGRVLTQIPGFQSQPRIKVYIYEKKVPCSPPMSETILYIVLTEDIQCDYVVLEPVSEMDRKLKKSIENIQ
jgi:hypothetical protein